MSILRFFRGLVDSEVAGEQIVISIQNLYEKTKKLSPFDDPHLNLAKTYFSRVRARIIDNPISRKIDPNDANTPTLILVESLLFSCLPDGHNVRALALKILADERPDIWSNYPQFENDLDLRMRMLSDQIESGASLFDLYKHQNAQLQLEKVAPFFLDLLRSGDWDPAFPQVAR